MKKNQDIIRQIKGFNITDRKYNLWMYYFTIPTSRLLLSIPKNSKLNAHYSNFNFADVSIKVLLHQAPTIEQNPMESLTALLHFNQPISQHYFKFCNLLLEINADKNILTKIVDEASTQLMRALLAFNYQFENEMDNIKNQKESAFFPFHYLTDFSNLIKVLLMASKPTFIDFLFLLTPILVLYHSVHDQNSIIFEGSQQILITLLDFLENYTCKEEEIFSLISYAISVSCANKQNNEKFAETCRILSSNKSLHPYISPKAYLNFLKRCKFTFDKICQSKSDTQLFELGMQMMQALASILDKKPDEVSTDISPSLLSFIEWSIKFDHLPEITVPTVSKRVILDEMEFKTDFQFEFYDCEMFDKSLINEKNYGLRSVSPVYLANSIILTSVVGITAEICSKNENVLSYIIQYLPQKGIIHLYVAVSIIFLCRPSSVGELLTKTNTWDLFVNNSIINDFTLFCREGVDKNMVNLKDLILSILFNLSTKEAAVSLCGLLDPNYPTVVFKIVELINMMLTDEFVKQLQQSPLFDALMKCYDCFRCYLVKHKNEPENEDTIYMKRSKSLILSFINTFSLFDESKLFIFSNNKRAYFVLSLLFEKHSFEMALDIVCRALETEHVNLLMRHLNKLIKFGFHHLDATDWQELISVLIDCVSVSISMNEKNLMKSFLKSGSIYTFSRIPAACSEVKNYQSSVRTVFHKIICFFTSLVQNMKNIIFYLSDPQWNFVPNLAKAIRSIDITDETVDLLINFTIVSDTLWIKEGIELLIVAVENKEVSKKILSFLVESTNKSIANRYQCFKANVITSLLSFILKNSNQQSTEETFEEIKTFSLNLLKNICSSFFRVGELSLTVRIISQAQTELAVSLIDLLLDLCEEQSQQYEDHNFSSQMAAIQSSSASSQKPTAPKAFFHFTTSSIFRINEFYIPATFIISMKVYLPKEYKMMKQLFLMTTASNDQQIEMNVIQNRLILTVKNKTRSNQFQMFHKLKTHQWFDLKLALTASTVTLFINSNQETSSVIPKRFRFQHPVLFSIKSIDADIQAINISSPDYYIFSLYDAKIVNEGNVINLAVGSPIPNAVFYGIPVPFCITFIDIIPSCGGPKIFLPLFEHAKSVELFKKLLQLLNSLICAKEAIFDPSFFRSFAHLLSIMSSEFFTSESLELILQIYKSIWNTPLRSAMLKYIFGNIDIWSKMNRESQHLLFSGIFAGLFDTDSSLFVKTLNFHSLLLKFSLFFDLTSNPKSSSKAKSEKTDLNLNKDDEILSDQILKETINFLFMISQRSFTPMDAKTLTAAAIDINSNEMCIKSLHLVINLIDDNSPGMIAYLKAYNFYQPFISILNSHSEKTRIISLNCMYIVQSMINDSLLSEQIIDGIRLLNVSGMTSKTLFSLISYMTKTVNTKHFPTIVEEFNFDEPKPIYFSQFLPLFATIVALNKEKERENCLQFVRKSIANFEETRKSFAMCNHYLFWLIFLSNADKKKDEWLSLMCSIILTNDTIISSIFSLIMFCETFGIDASKSVDFILTEAIAKRATVKLAMFIIKYVLFKIDQNRKRNEQNLDDSVHKFCQEFVLASCPSFTFVCTDQVTEESDLKMLISAVKFLIMNDQFLGIQQHQPALKRAFSIQFQQQQQQQQQLGQSQSQNIERQEQFSRMRRDSTPNFISASSSSLLLFVQTDDKFDLKNVNELNLALVCFSICKIAQQDKDEAKTLHNLLINRIMNHPNPSTIKNELRKCLLLLHNFYTKNGMSQSDSVVYTIRQIDSNFATIISPEKIITMSESVHNNFTRELPTICASFQTEFNSGLAVINKKSVIAIQRVFAEENQKLVQLRNDFTRKLTNSAQEQERFLKGNRKFYKSQLKEMSLQNGGPWFSIPSMPHFKFNFVLDRIGRHNKMSVNFKFKDHKMASILRDTGDSSTVPTATTTPQNNENVKIIKGMRIDVSNEVESPNDFTIELECQMVKAAKYFKGKMYLTQSSIFFEVKQTTDAFGEIIDKMSKLIEINNENIRFILKRRYLFIDSACEVFTTYNKSYFFVFATEQNRSKFFKEIDSFKLKNIEFIQFGDSYKLYKELQLQKKWNSGAMSNYEYLTWLNMLSGRSIHDISQYPVFPWVISDYTSDQLNLQDENSYRDLSKPIGALNQERLESLKFLYNETKKTPYACLYRFHYSTPAYVIAFLLRNEPFTSLHIQLQNGKFDNPNRLVYSIPQSWESVTSINSDFRELIPEFFATPEFLINSERYDLGCRVDLVPIHKSASFTAIGGEIVAKGEEEKKAESCQELPKQDSVHEKEGDAKSQPQDKLSENSEAKEEAGNEIESDKNESVEAKENAGSSENTNISSANNESAEPKENFADNENSVTTENTNISENAEPKENIANNENSVTTGSTNIMDANAEIKEKPESDAFASLQSNSENSGNSDASLTQPAEPLQVPVSFSSPCQAEPSSSSPSLLQLSVRARQRRKSKPKVVCGKDGELFVNESIPVDDVALPPWAPTASAFVAINRIALESPIVSSSLHSWIDLVFGAKQRSEESDNLFHPFTYLSTLEKEPELVQLIQQHAANFGVTPFQLFKKPHQKRTFIPRSNVLNTKEPLFFKSALLQDFASLTAQTVDQGNESEEQLLRQMSLSARERSKERILKIASAGVTFYALFCDGTFRTFSFNERRLLVPQKTSSLEITTNMKQERVFIDAANKSIVISPTWSTSFAKIHKTMIFSPTNSHATAVTAIAVSSDGCFAVTGAGDASIIVWDLVEEKLQCHVVAHTESIKTLAISSDLEVVASCDEGGTLVLSDLKTGKFLRKVKFGSPPKRTLISNLGFIALVFESLAADEDDEKVTVATAGDRLWGAPEGSAVGARKTKIVLIDMGARVIGEVELEGKSTAALIIENNDATAFICTAQETKIFYIMRIYDLKIVAMGPVKETIIDVCYCKEDLSLYLLLDNNSVHVARLGA